MLLSIVMLEGFRVQIGFILLSSLFEGFLLNFLDLLKE